jgi:hypothetical protein
MPAVSGTTRPSFESWMARVDSLLESTIGLDSGCLEDRDYWSAYDAGQTPVSVVREIVTEIPSYFD